MSSTDNEGGQPNPQSTPSITNQGGNIAIGNNITQNSIQHIPPSPKPAVAQHAIPDVSRTVGRERELVQLARRLGQAGTTAIVAALGVPGIGKSTLAAIYCQQHRGEFDWICWRDLRRDATITGLLQAVAEKIGVEFDPATLPNEENQAAKLVEWLTASKALVIADNCETVLDEQGNALGGWAVLLGTGQMGQSRLLLTSRHQIRAGRVRVVSYQIDALTQADGVALLRGQGLHEEDEKQLEQAVKYAGGHPLALIFLAQLVTEDSLKLPNLLKQTDLWDNEVAENLLNEVYGRLLPAQQQLLQYVSIFDRPDHFRHPVASAEIAGTLAQFDLAPRRVAYQASDPRYNGKIRNLDVEAIAWLLHPPARPQLVARAGWDEQKVKQLAVGLSRRSLLNVEAGRYTMHAIVRDYAYHLLPEPAAHHRAAALHYLHQYFDTHPDAYSHPAQNLADVQPLLDAFDQFCAAGNYADADRVMKSTPLQYMSSGEQIILSSLLDRWGEFSRLARMEEFILNTPAGIIGERERAGAMVSLGIAYFYLGNYQQAIAYYLQSLAIGEQLGDIQLLGQIFSNLGNVYYSLKDYQRAMGYYSQALTLARQIGDIHLQGNSLGQLGIIYYSLGYHDQAIEYYLQSLAIGKQLGDLQLCGQMLSNLGVAYSSLGEYLRAISHFQQALILSRQVGDVVGQGMHWNNLGMAYKDLRHYLYAMACYLRAMPIFEHLGISHYIATTRRNIADTQAVIGEEAWHALYAAAQRLAADARWQPAVSEDTNMESTQPLKPNESNT